MMKRALSFLLCLIMVLGLSTPAVQASNTENIYIEEGASVSGVSGNPDAETDTPDVEIIGPNEDGFSAVQDPVLDYSNTAEVLCNCGIESEELLNHSDSCVQKRYCIELCAKSAMDIYNLWYSISMPERTFIKEYLGQHYPDTLDVLQKIWNSDMIADENDLTDFNPDMPLQYTGQASAQVGDITVDAHGIPEGSSLYVTDPTKKITNAVEDMAAELGENPEQLFLYDISVQNEETDNWQPEGDSVYMTLTVPGVNLHKYAAVYVLHVDDDGNASTIQASVDENGDIAFFTDGFSTFAGFTVDFKYGDAFFSIDGMTDIKLSQLFDELRMPLYASDVIDLQFTDETLVSVTRLAEENDWLLTSLRAFQTQEILTVTMKDGNVFKINVTDATAFIYVGGGGYGLGTRYDLDGNGICTWYADGDGELDTQGYLNSAQNDGWSRTNTIYIGGSGKFTIGIKPWVNVTTRERAYILLNQIRVCNKVQLNVYLTSDFDSTSIKNVHLQCAGEANLFIIEDGASLWLEGRPPTSTKEACYLTLDGWNDEIRQSNTGKTAVGLLSNNKKDNQLIQLTDGASGLICDYVRFQDAPRSAIRIANGEAANSSNRMQEFKLTNCIFDKDVRRENTANNPATGSGGAIYLQETANKMDGTTNYTWMDEIYLENCTFNGTYAAESGGALGIYGRVKDITIKNCTFNGTSSKRGYGGAMVMAGHCGSLTIQDTIFDNCSSTVAGGAIYIVSRVLWSQYNTYSRLNMLTISGCEFKNSGDIANNKSINSPLGGAISLDTSIHTVSITDSTFTGLRATEGAGICFGYTNMVATNSSGEQAYISNDNFIDTTTANTTIVPPGAEGTGGSNYYRTSIGATTISDCEFKDLKAETQGGAIRFRTNSSVKSVEMNNVNFDACEAVQAGSAIMLGDTIIPSFTYTNSTIQNCKTTLTDSTEVGGSFRTIGKTTCAASLTNITFINNSSHCSGGGVYWNAAGMRYIEETDDPIITAIDISQCTFDGNTAGWYGGGIYCESVMTVTGCELKNNVSVKMGGGIALQLYNNTVRPFADNEITNLTLDASTNIHHNQSKVGGGISVRANATQAIDNSIPYGHTIQFNLGGAQVHHNYATADGGGVWFNVEEYDSSTENGAANQQEVERFNKAINLVSGSIYSNTAGGNGGGVYMNGGVVTDPEVTSIGQLNSNGSVSINLSGAAIYDNEAGRSMTGVITSEEDVLPPSITVTKDASNGNIQFTKSTASATGGNGGGIYLYGNTGICTIVGGVIGATKNADGTPGTASKNIATRSPGNGNGGTGGGVAIFGQGRIVMDGGYVVNNTADTAGGGIAVHDRSSMYLASGTIQNNQSHIGGGISLNNALPYKSNSNLEEEKYGLYLNGGILSGNKVIPDETRQNFALGGGICASAASIAKVSDGLITQNIAASNVEGTTFEPNQEGGGIAVCEGATLILAGGTISENKAYSGGGMVLRGSSTVNMTGSLTVLNGKVQEASAKGVIKKNYAYQDAGGVYLGPYTGNSVNRFTMTNGWIYDNEADNGWGGGVYVGKYNGFYLRGGYIEENTSNGYGGAIYATQAVIEISNGVIQGNVAQTGHGGAIYAYDTTVTITNGVIQSNTALSGSGGGLYITEGKLFFYGNKNGYGSILNNRAPQGCGGGICGKRVTETDLDYLRLEGNSSKYGGGIYLEFCSGTTIDGGVFTKNYSNQGAGLFIRSGSSTITGGEFTWNVAGPPAKLDDGSYLYVEDSIAQHGGGIVVDDLTSTAGDSWVKILGGNISHNTAPNGGGIWLKNIATNRSGCCPNVTMEGGSITYNTANYGGGVLVDGNGYASDVEKTTFTMKGGNISYNTANGYGGGVYATGRGEVCIMENATTGTHGTISYNKAHCGGGVGVGYGANLTVENGYITHNTAFVPSKPATTPANTGYQQLVDLYGAGGGVFVAEGTSSAYSSFTLTGTNMAIYDNEAGFSGDDVFSNGNQTQLDVPHVNEMNLAGYGLTPEGWFEDYNVGDPMYTDTTSTALRMLMVNKAPDSVTVQRYRASNAVKRRYSHIKPVYVSGQIMGKDDAGNDVVVEAVPDNATYVNKVNAYVAMTLGIPGAVEDTVVVDYGVSVKINVLENDLFMNLEDFASSAELGYLIPTGVSEKDGIYYSTAKDSDGNDVDHIGTFYGDNLSNSYMEYGWAYLTKNDGMITYKRSSYENTLDFEKEEVLTYTLKHGKNWFYTEVTVIPATTVYYEDNITSIKYHTQDDCKYDQLADWEVVGSVTNDLQDQDCPGVSTLEDIDADNIYGFDSNYATSTTYSGGAIHKVTVTRQNASTTTNARATFVFTGTGFDIISLCSKATGLVTVSVYEGKDGIIFEDDPSTREWEATAPYKTWMVDTYYNAGDTLYQVPVIKVSDLPYGTYTAELYIAPSFMPNEHAYYTADFYLDAIRIYDPAGVGGDNCQLAQDAYKADGEAWPAYAEIRNMFINQGDLNDDTAMEGILFIDGQDSPTLDTYRSWGPNNEIYLKPGQSVAFMMDTANYGQNIAAVHLGLRGLTAEGHVSVQAKGGEEDAKSTVLATSLSVTDMYYDITEAMDKVVTVTNDGESPISISTVKVTHTEPPINGYSLRKMFMADLETANIALDILTPEQLADPVLIPKYPALSFNGMVCYNVFFSAEDLGDLTSADLGLAVFESYDSEGTVETAKEVILGATEIDGLYMVATNGVHAKQLGDTQYFRVFAKKADGSYIYSKMVSYSALDYAMNILSKSNDVKLKQLVAAMLNYGAAAQAYFGYNTDNLVNATMTEEQLKLPVAYRSDMVNNIPVADAAKQGVFANNKGFSMRKPAVSFEGAFSINYFFTPAYAPVDGITLYYWAEADYNAVDELTVENATGSIAMEGEGMGQYRGDIEGIAAKSISQAVYVAAVYSDGTTTWTSGVLGYSIGAYCGSLATKGGMMADLAMATAVYGYHAKAYFGQ